MVDEIKIPRKHQDVCREIAQICRKHGLTNFSGTFKPGYSDEWRADISFRWESGRHEEDVNKVFIWSQMSVNTNIDDRPLTSDEIRSQMIGESP